MASLTPALSRRERGSYPGAYAHRGGGDRQGQSQTLGPAGRADEQESLLQGQHRLRQGIEMAFIRRIGGELREEPHEVAAASDNPNPGQEHTDD